MLIGCSNGGSSNRCNKTKLTCLTSRTCGFSSNGSGSTIIALAGLGFGGLAQSASSSSVIICPSSVVDIPYSSEPRSTSSSNHRRLINIIGTTTQITIFKYCSAIAASRIGYCLDSKLRHGKSPMQQTSPGFRGLPERVKLIVGSTVAETTT